MKVLFTHPCFWPYVRRGAERELHGAGIRLQQMGNEVSLLTSMPGGIYRRAEVEGLDVRYVRMPHGRVLSARGWDEETAFYLPVRIGLKVLRPDIVHAWHYVDAAAAARTTRRHTPLVLKLTGTVIRDRIRELPVHYRLLMEALDGADEVWCNSRYAREVMKDFGVSMRVVPAGIDPGRFFPDGSKASVPTVFVASSADEPRKRLVDIIDAWPDVAGGCPGATLRIAGHASPATRSQLLARIPESATAGITFLGMLDDDSLRREYSAAWCTVAPAVYEALGLVTVESWACGTPVIGARSGATEELIAGSDKGRLVDPMEPTRWAEALCEVLADHPGGTSQPCVAASVTFHWDQVMPTYMERYAYLTGAHQRAV